MATFERTWVDADPPPDVLLLAGAMKDYTAEDKDIVMAVTGNERSGKSTLAAHLACLLNGGLDLQRDFLYLPEDFLAAIQTRPPGHAVVSDESMRLAYKREAMTREHRMMNHAFAEIGRRNLCVMMVLPNFNDLDAYLRNWRVRMWVHVFDRGRAAIFTRSRSPFASDPWLLDRREDHYDRMTRAGHPAAVAIATSPLCIGVLAFPGLSTDVDAAYRSHKEWGLSVSSGMGQRQKVIGEATRFKRRESHAPARDIISPEPTKQGAKYAAVCLGDGVRGMPDGTRRSRQRRMQLVVGASEFCKRREIRYIDSIHHGKKMLTRYRREQGYVAVKS